MAKAVAKSTSGTPVLVAVGITALAPFVMPAGSLDPYTLRFAGILVAACAWLWAWVLDPGAFRFTRRTVYAALAVASALLLSAAFSFSPGIALTWGAEGGFMSAPVWLSLLAVYVFAASVKPSARIARTLWLAFLWAAVSATLIAIERFSEAKITGGFGNSNYAGAALVALVPLAMFFARSESDKRIVNVMRVLVVALLIAIPMAGSVANMLALAVVLTGVLLLAPAGLLGIDHAGGRRAALVVLGLLVAAAALLGLAASTDILPAAIDAPAAGVLTGPTTLTRVEMWKMATAMWLDHPVLGVGPAGIQHASQAYLTERLLQLEAGALADYQVLMRDPHSLPLLVLASVGLLGALALLWLAYEWVRTVWRSLSRDRDDSRSAALRAALALGVLGHLFALLFMPWAILFGPLLPLLAGLAVAGTAEDAEQFAVTPEWGRIAGAVGGTLLAVSLVFAAVYGQLQVAAARAQTSPGAAAERYRAAAQLQPTRPYLAYEALYAQGVLASEGLDSLESYRASVDAAPKEVTESGPYLVNLVQVSLDEAYLSGREDLAWERERLERASRLAPRHPEVLLEQAHLALLAGETDKAGALLDRTARMAGEAPRQVLYSYYRALASGDESAAAGFAATIERSTPAMSRLLQGWNPEP